MNALHGFNRNKKRLAAVYEVERSKIEELQKLLTEEYGAKVSYEDAAQVAHGLTTYYRILANGRTITKGGLCELMP
jgi:hypothetical protein